MGASARNFLEMTGENRVYRQKWYVFNIRSYPLPAAVDADAPELISDSMQYNYADTDEL